MSECSNMQILGRCDDCTPPEKKECRPDRHVFGEGDGGVSLTEGESATCLCGSMAARLEDGQIKVSVQAALLNERIDVSIHPTRQSLGPGDTFSATISQEEQHG